MLIWPFFPGVFVCFGCCVWGQVKEPVKLVCGSAIACDFYFRKDPEAGLDLVLRQMSRTLREIYPYT